MGIGHHVNRIKSDQEARAVEATESIAATPTAEPGAGTSPAPAEDPSIASAFTLMAQLLQEIRATQSAEKQQAAITETERLLLERQRFELERDRQSRQMPENLMSPEISVYSHPKGNKADPKPTLKVKTLWCGHEIDENTVTPEEIEALNALVSKPGEYQVSKADGQKIPFRVAATYSDVYGEDNRPKVEKLSITFPCKGDHRQNHLSMLSYCTQAMTGAIPNTDDLLAEVARLRAELARDTKAVLTSV